MGLDIYFYKHNKPTTAEQVRKEKDYHNDHTLYAEEVGECHANDVDVAYFRKVSWLMTYFGYEGNCEYVEIGKSEIEDLVEQLNTALNVLDKPKEEWTDEDQHALAVCEPTAGFFWNCSSESSKESVEYVRDEFSNMLNSTNWETQEIYMYCWW